MTEQRLITVSTIEDRREIREGLALLIDSTKADYDLTPHELRLLRLMAEGHSYKSAAAILHVTAHAVSFHLRHIYEKLQVHTKSQAVAEAFRTGLV